MKRGKNKKARDADMNLLCTQRSTLTTPRLKKRKSVNKEAGVGRRIQ